MLQAPSRAAVTTTNFLRTLFNAARQGGLVEVQAIPGMPQRLDPRDLAVPEEFEPAVFWNFAVCLRNSRGEVVGGTVVWLDVDHPKDGWSADALYPEPTAVVCSGKGRHVYWVLDEQVDPERVVRLAHLAKAAYGGDKQTLETKRKMRLPGSFNTKYSPPIQSYVEVWRPGNVYGPRVLEEELLTAVIAEHAWGPGARHGTSLGLGALLARAEWEEDRVEGVARALVALGGGEERDVVNAAIGSVRKHDAGGAVSVQYLKEALGEIWKDVIDGLGITSRDGDVLLNGVSIGKVETIERDLVSFVISSGDWGWDEGSLSRWDGKCWNAATHQDVLTSYIFDVMARLIVVANGSEFEFQAKPRMARDVAGIVQGSLSSTSLPPEAPDMVALDNGVVDLKDLALKPHDKTYYNRWTLPFNYDPGAGEPRTWTTFLDFAIPGGKEFLQEWFGYLLTPGNPWQRMLWLYGPSGTGKSTVLKVASWLMGLDPHQAKKGAAIAVNADNFREYSLASLHGKRLATCSELSRKMMRTALIKAIVGGDPVEARHPYGRIFSLVFTGVVMFGSNSLPPVDEGEGMWRRMVILPFENKPERADEKFDEKLRAELPGILLWALEGHRKMAKYYMGEEWTLPECAQVLVGEYKKSADTFAQFAEDELLLLRDWVNEHPGKLVSEEVRREYEVASQELYHRYATWARDRGQFVEPLGPKFWSEMRKLGLEPVPLPRKRKGRLVRTWAGAKLMEEEVSFGN